jgi:DivIVA domain-containing protein
MTTTDPRVSPQFQTHTSIREETFHRRMLGLDADEVYEYLDRLADQVQATERELSETRSQKERLEAELARVRADLAEYEQMGDRVNDQVVQMFSQAQLVAEQMVEDCTRDARERISHARDHERRIVEEAMGTAGEQVRSYARAAQAQMESVMSSFASEVDRLGSPSVSRDSNDPLFGDAGDWKIKFRNGDGSST